MVSFKLFYENKGNIEVIVKNYNTDTNSLEEVDRGPVGKFVELHSNQLRKIGKHTNSDGILDMIAILKSTPNSWIKLSEPGYQNPYIQVYRNNNLVGVLTSIGYKDADSLRREKEQQEESEESVDSDEKDNGIDFDIVYQQQYEIIKERFGVHVAEHANYGWSSSDTNITTKVYGQKGISYLSSSFDIDGATPTNIQHNWESDDDYMGL